MARRERKGETREERRRGWMKVGGDADLALLAPVLADPLYGRALQALDSDDEQVYGAPLRALVARMHELVPLAEHDRADKLLGVHLTYDAERRAGRSHEEAFAAAQRFRPLRYPLSDRNTTWLDLRGDLHMPAGLGRAEAREAIQFREDILGKAAPAGRPRGRALSRDQWEAGYRSAVQELKRERRRLTDENVRIAMALGETAFKTYKREYGVPRI